MNATRLVLLSIGCATLSVTTPAGGRAQVSSMSLGSASSCLASISDSALRRVVVFVQAELIDSTDRPILPAIDLLTQEVADSVRASLGTARDSLPNGEPEVTWRGLDARLLVVARRDGRITSKLPTSEPSPSGDGERADTAAAHVLAQALATIAGGDGYFMIWPDGFEPDSVAFHLVTHYPFVNSRGTVTSLRVRQAFPLFSVGMPPLDPVVTRQRPKVRYPRSLQMRGVIGNLLMSFIVDTTGRADMTTMKDIWPSSQPRLTGELGEYYESFWREVVRAIANTSFEPARVGGCKVKQLVQMPFGFRMGR